MRRMWIGIGLLALMLAGGLWAADWMQRVHGEMAADLNRGAQLALESRWEEAEHQADRAQRAWQKKRPVTAAFADHEPLEEIDGLFSRLQVLAEGRAVTEFAAECRQLAILADAIADTQGLTWWSLL